MANSTEHNTGAALAAFALKRPVTISMIFLSMLLLGVVSSRLLPLEKFPGIDFPGVFIEVPYPNSTPTEVERTITRPIEEALATISGIERLSSNSFENRANIQLFFDWGVNIKAKSIEAREKLDAIRQELPDDVERVIINQFNIAEMPVFQLRISSDRDLSLAWDMLERNLKRPMERVQGVSQVSLYGVNKREIQITVDAEKLTALSIPSDELVQTLSSYNFSMTAGHIINGNRKIIVNPQGEFRDIDEIRNLIIRKGVRLKDVATIQMALPEPFEGRHLNQTYAIGMDVHKEANANLVEVAERALKVIDKASANPQFKGINLYIMDNAAEGVTNSLSDLLNAGLLGAFMSMIVLYLFLRNLPTTLIVVTSVPFAICITLGVMYLMDYTLNILSMMGLMLAIGMLVDNAVVVTESIFQQKKLTSDPVKATTMGVGKVSLAVIAGTVTTAIVFLPNIVGKKVQLTIFLEHVAISICISLFASLIISQTLIPLLASKIKQPVETKPKKPGRLQRFYDKVLSLTLNNQKTSSVVAILLFASIAIPLSVVSNDENPDDSRERLFMNFHVISSFPLEEMEDMVTEMENYLYANKDEFHIESVYSYYNTDRAESTIILQDDMPISMSELKEKIRANWPVLARANPSFGFNQGNGGGVRINLQGPSTDVLMKISESILPAIKGIEGLEDVTSDVNANQYELQVIVDRTMAHRLGLSARDVATKVATALRGRNLRTYRSEQTGEVRVLIKFNEEFGESTENLLNLPVIRQDGRVYTLDSLASIKTAPRAGQIRRYERQTGLRIQANLADDFTLDEAKAELNAIIDSLSLPHGYDVNLGGSFQRQEEENSIMAENMLLAIAMIYIVMAALFESILLPTAVLSSLFLSFVGAFWAFLITGTPMSVMGMIGMLILMGIVVNNGIVLVDQINQLSKHYDHLHDAIIEACRTRVRPILMTVATTILGLIPLALGGTQIGGDGPPYTPMAIAIIGGLVFSTLTSLVLVPLTYVLLLKLRFRTSNMIKRARALASQTPRLRTQR